MAKYMRRHPHIDGEVLDAEQWSRRDETLPAVQEMLREFDGRIAIAEIKGPQGECLLLIRHPAETSLAADNYTVVRDWEWILPVRYGDGVQIISMRGQDFDQAFECAP